MGIWSYLQTRYRQTALLNGALPLGLIILFFFIGPTYFFPIGYFVYGWLELLMLSTFVSVVPDAAYWYLFGMLRLVGAEMTANLTLTLLISFGSILILIGCFLNDESNKNVENTRSNYFWLIGGILTFPLGLVAIYDYYITRPIQELSLKDRILSELRKNKLPYILIIPAMVFLVFTYIVPILRGFYITLFSYPEGNLSRAFTPVDYNENPLLWTIHAVLGGLQKQDPIFVGLDNYLELFSQTTRATSFQNALDNNIYFVILFVPGVVIVSLLLAVLLNHKLIKGENAYTTIYYMPVVTSILVVSVIWGRVILEPRSGLLTLFFDLIAPILNFSYTILNLLSLGIIPANTVKENINWIADYLMECIALMGIWRRVGFNVLILLAGLKSIPDSLYEAADIDGHGSWSKFRNITIPMLKGPLGVVIILELINGWLVFQELYGLNVAQFGGDYTLAVYLIANYASPSIMTFASTVGYFIFGMTAYLGLLGRTEIKNILRGIPLFALLAILFSIPSNRTNISAKSLGFTISWWTFDLLFLVLALILVLYYLFFDVVKYKEIEADLKDLRISGVFILFTVPFYLFNGYNTITESGFGSTPIWIIPSFVCGLFFLFISLLMVFAKLYVPIIKKQGWTPFLFDEESE